MEKREGLAVAPVWHSSLMLFVTTLLSAAAFAGPALTPHSAEYKIKISVLGGQLNTELKATADGYVATHVIKATGMSRMFARGMIKETSEFYAAPDGVRPSEYSSTDTLSRDKSNASIRFDWDTGEARGTVNGGEVFSVLDALAHDRVSIQYELMHDLLNAEPSPQYTMFEIDRLRTVNVRNIGHKRVKVPAGRFDAVGIQHQAEGSSRITTLWCVEDLGYLPVIIEQHRKGKLRVRATLRKFSPAESAHTVRSEL
jgi:hypothetical protein